MLQSPRVFNSCDKRCALMGSTNRGAKVRHETDDLEVSCATAGVGVGDGMI